METFLYSDGQATAVKRLLRRRGSTEFFKGDGWTQNPDEALTYAGVLEAAETCVRCGLTDVELALRLDPQGCDLFCMQIR